MNNKSNFLPLMKSAISLLVALATTLGAAQSWAAGGEEDAKSLFMTTANIPTEAGEGRLEIQVYDINNAEDLAEAKKQIEAQLGSDPRSQEVFNLTITATDHLPSSLDVKAEAVASALTNSIQTNNLIPNQKVKVDSPIRSFLKKNYNLSLAVMRFVANTGVISVGLVLGKHVPMEQALIIGALAGTMSAAIQLKSDLMFKYLSNSVLLVNTAKKLKLIKTKPGEPEGRFEKILRGSETYGRWGSVELAFLEICELGMHLFGIPISDNVLVTTAKSTASQGVFEVGVMKLTKNLEGLSPAWAGRATVFKNVALFAGSGVSVLSAIGAMTGMPIANLGFVTLAATGIALNFAPKLATSETVQSIMKTWRPSPVISCQAIMAR